MLRRCLDKLQINVSARQTLLSSSSSFTKARAISSLYREASTYTNRTPAETQEEPRTYNRRYVQVDTPFAIANKYTYVMPDDAYVASDRVTKILEIGTVDDAADYIKALPIGLQSPIVWNQLIGFCAKHGRANYAEQFYSQVYTQRSSSSRGGDILRN